jgi:hypothetical protein
MSLQDLRRQMSKWLGFDESDCLKWISKAFTPLFVAAREGGPSTSLGSDATEKSAENDENAQNQCVVPKYEKRTRASTNLGLVDCTRVPGDYLRLGPHVQLVAWTHSDRCVMAALAQAKDVPDSCPVCERHRKLYGYRWPKTKKTGKSDNEESVYSLASWWSERLEDFPAGQTPRPNIYPYRNTKILWFFQSA